MAATSVAVRKSRESAMDGGGGGTGSTGVGAETA